MLTTKEVAGVKVVRPNKPGKEYTKDGLPRHRRKIGKIYKTVFAPDGMRVVGFIVRRPDLLWMFKRPERFLALDAFDIQDGLVVPSKGMASWDDKAIERMGVDYDTCIIWEGIQVKTRSGAELGHVGDISFDEKTGNLNSLFLDDGGVARSLIGAIEIPAELMVGYKKGVLIVEDEASELLPSGGLAAKAGEATARASAAGKEGIQKAGKAAGKAVDAGAVGVGKLIGRAKRSVTGAVEEFREESGANERAAAKKAASEKAATAAKAGSGKAAANGSATKKAAGSGSGASTKKTASTTKKTSSMASQSEGSKTKSVGQAVGDHMKGVGSMFSDFKKEFDKYKD